MKQWISNLQILIFTTLFALTACADSPQSPVAGSGAKDNTGSGNVVEEEGSITAMAVKYEGKDTQGRQCDLYVSIHEEEAEEDGHQHGHHYLIKLDYSTPDGHKPHAGEAQFYLYDSNTGEYFDEDSNKPDTTLSLLSLSMVDEDAVADVSKVNEYISNNELEQLIRVEFNNSVDAETFEETLESVLEGNSNIDDNLNIFNSIQLLTLASLHGDHYHFPTCLNYKAKSVEEVEFELEGHDDHDHEH